MKSNSILQSLKLVLAMLALCVPVGSMAQVITLARSFDASCYEAEGSVRVTLSLDVDEDNPTIPPGVAVEETLPEGWIVANPLPNYGSYNEETGLVMWLQFGEVSDAIYQYDAVSPAGFVGTAMFSAVVKYSDSGNPVELPATGPTQLDKCNEQFGPQISIADDIQAVPGEVVAVEVHLSEAVGLFSYRVAVNFDADKVSYVDGSATKVETLTSSFEGFEVNDTVPGGLVISSAGTEALGSGSGPIVKFDLLLGDGIQDSVPLNIDATLSRLNDGAIPSTTRNGSLMPVWFRWGDVACPLDGFPGGLDASRVLAYDALLPVDFSCHTYMEPAGHPSAGDVNGDGIMGGMDASLILMYDAQLIDHFPVDTNQDGFGPDAPVGPQSPLSLKTIQERALELGSTIGAPGSIVYVPVSADGFQDAVSFRLAIDYDSSKLDWLSVKTAGTLSASLMMVTNGTVPGQLVVSAAGSEAIGTGEGTLVTLEFRIREETGGSAALSFGGLTRVNDSSEDLVLQGGSVSIHDITRVDSWSVF